MTGESDFDFLQRGWNVRHRKLATRLAGANDWQEFDGTSTTRPILAGHGNIEDNYLDDPAGAYHAAALRAFEASTGLWRIWWLDMRDPTELGAPLVGRFDGARGEFLADDHWNHKPIKVRFVWLKHHGAGPMWEQSFSEDGGVTWEPNWTMRFS
ncbi:MAG: DUF1579 domain-containing protein [Parvibaculaceae bacterium]